MTRVAQRQPTASKRILLVEDDPIVASSLRMLLALAGYQADTVGHAEGALALFDPLRHAVVITDLHLPGMNGLELADALRRRASQQPIILISGSPEVVAAKVNSGSINVLLGKPFDLEQLREALASSLSSGQPKTLPT